MASSKEKGRESLFHLCELEQLLIRKLALNEAQIPCTYNAGFFRRHNTILDPDSVASHEVSHHHIRHQPVTDYGDLIWSRDTCLGVLAEVLHDLRPTTGFFGTMGKHCDSGRLLDFGGKPS